MESKPEWRAVHLVLDIGYSNIRDCSAVLVLIMKPQYSHVDPGVCVIYGHNVMTTLDRHSLHLDLADGEENIG